MMKCMGSTAGLTEKFTNHSIRKRSITTLLHEGVDSNIIAQYSGHRNVASINNYAVASDEQQREMSHILQKIPCQQSHSRALTSQQRPALPCSNVQSILPAPVPRQSPSSTITSMQAQNTSSTGASISGFFAGVNIHGGTFDIHVHGLNASQNGGVAPALRESGV